MRRILILMCLLPVLGFAEAVTFDNNWAENPLFSVISENPAGVEIIFSTYMIMIEETEIDGIPMKTFGVPGVFLPNDEGAPNLAGAGRYIAIPQGAEAIFTILDSRIEIYHNVEVAPAPNIPSDSDDSPLRFEKNMEIYTRNAYYPESPVKLSRPKKIRGVDAVILGITPFQYNSVTKELIVYKDIRVRVDFIGGNGHFGEDRLRSRFWEPILQNHLLNYSSLPEIDFYSPERKGSRDNVEYIIIVPDDAVFEAWGDTIKTWRQLQGISSEVFNLTQVGGSDSSRIKSFLEDAYNTWSPAPVAFLLLSDYSPSGKAYGITSPILTHPWGPPYLDFASDNWYADFDNDTLPELHHARICAQTNAELSTMINKFLSYERSPYTSSAFYNNPLVAGAWQTSRWFQLCCEVIRGFFITGLGKNPAVEYNVYSGSPSPGCAWSTNVNTGTVVQYWYNVGWLPDTLNQNTYSWWNSGSTSGVTNAINSGAFLVQHRDHGGVDGWSEPSYDTTDLDNLTNTEFTFVFSINCYTGRYHSSRECFTEKFHRITYGALGVNAATSASASFVNDTYVWGIYDCLWPQFDPNYPVLDMTGYDNLRPCMAMTSGKYYLEAHNWPYNANDKNMTYGLFHHHGDVFTTLYSEIPQSLTVSHASLLPVGQTFFTVIANNSSVIALTVDGDIIGVAEGTGSPLDIPITAQSAGDTMLVTVTKANYYRYTSLVPVGGGLTELKTYSVGSSAAYSSISAYHDTMICVFEYDVASPMCCRYLTSYNGGTSWFYGVVDGSSTRSERPDVTARDGGGEGIVYRYYTPTRELRYKWRNYAGGWSAPVSIADNEPYYNKPSIEYLGGGLFGVVYLSWTSPVVRGAFFDRSDWTGIEEETSEDLTSRQVILAPNPSVGTTRLSYFVEKEGNVNISAYDVTGRMVKRLIDKSQKVGRYSIDIDCKDLASGIYFIRIKTTKGIITKSLALVR